MLVFYFQILLFLFIYLACFLSVWFYIWCLDKHFDHIVILICRYIYIFDIPLVIHSSLARLLVLLFVCPFIRLRDCWRDVHAWGNWKSVITIFDGIQIVSSASANNEFCLFFHYVSRARRIFGVFYFFYSRSFIHRRDFCRQTKLFVHTFCRLFEVFHSQNDDRKRDYGHTKNTLDSSTSRIGVHNCWLKSAKLSILEIQF